MRPIDADTLMPSFIKKANTMKDRHGVKLGEDWLLNYNDIKDVIENAPTIDTQAELIVARSQGYERGFAEGYEEGFAKGKETPIEDLSDYSDKLWKLAYEREKAEGRKTGRWIEHTSEEMSKLGFVKCSKCKAGFRRYERGIRHSDLSWIDGQPYELHLIDNFCPNCGADMRGNE